MVTVNQEQGGGQWSLLGSFDFNSGPASISLSDDANDYVIADAVMLVPAGAAPNTATWTLNVPSAGSYQVYARWTQHPNRATDARYTVTHAAGSTQVTVDMEQGGGNWNLLGSFDFAAGNATVSLTDQANGYVIADAIMLTPPGAAPNTATWTPNVAQAGTYEVYARWTSHANRATNATYTVTHGSGSSAVTVDQQQGGATWNLLGTFSLSPGNTHKISLTDQANGFVIADAIRLVPISIQAEQKLYFVHVDHLNTPRLVADATGTTVWRWDQQEPFGNSPADQNPGGLGVFDLPLRLPGQYFDGETGLLYNGARDYDPQFGRYIQSDPIGLEGGLNVYAYALNAPIINSDPSGLAVIPQEVVQEVERVVSGRPPKVPGMYACNARCPTQPARCPAPDCPVVYGYGQGPDLGIAVRNAKADANSKIPAGCQGKHCTYKCTGPRGDPIYPSRG